MLQILQSQFPLQQLIPLPDPLMLPSMPVMNYRLLALQRVLMLQDRLNTMMATQVVPLFPLGSLGMTAPKL